MKSKSYLFFSCFIVLTLFNCQPARPNESIKNGVPALPRQGEMHKSREKTISDELILTSTGKSKQKERILKKSLKKLIPASIKVVTMKVTAYCGVNKKSKHSRKRRKMNGTGITKSGKVARVGFAAADLKRYPIGTVFYVPKVGRVVVEDSGGSIVGNHIDIFMGRGEKAHKDAMDFGKQKLPVIVVAQRL